MQNSPEMIGQAIQDQRENSMEESPMMTIEYLRARLLSERSVSKAAKERAEELVKRVEKLEEQLKLVTFQRKRAEKATLEVLSFLASHGIGDISEVDESESDREESPRESNEEDYDATQESGNFGPLKLNGNDEGCGSDHASTTSSSRPLSWKGRKETTWVSNKKYADSSIMWRGSFSQAGSSQRHHHGKSCRQIKRKEMRSMVEGLGHDSAKSDDAQDNKIFDSSEANKTSPEKQFPRVHQKNEVPLSLLPHAQEIVASSPIHKHKYSGDMQRALKHQAKLIGRYEAQEEAQRDWEDRYEENNTGTPDSCEPGNHSDVTEERDENKESVAHPSQIVAHHREDPKGGSNSNQHGKNSSDLHFNGFKFSPDADNTIFSQNHDSIKTQAPRSIPPDSSFSTMNNYQENLAQSSPHLNQSVSSTSSSFAGSSSFYESELPENQNRHRELVPIKGPQSLGSVLGALQEAKLLIKQQITVFPETNSYSSALFRVPTNLHSQAPTQSKFLGSDYEYSYVLRNSSPYSRALPSQDDLHTQAPTPSRFPGSDYEYSPVLRNSSPYSIAPTQNRFPGSNNDYSSELRKNSSPKINATKFEPASYSRVTDAKDGIANGLPGEDFLFDTRSSNTSYPSFPDFFPGSSSKQMSGTSAQSGSTMYYNHMR